MHSNTVQQQAETRNI